jgi:hypothetical protein
VENDTWAKVNWVESWRQTPGLYGTWSPVGRQRSSSRATTRQVGSPFLTLKLGPRTTVIGSGTWVFIPRGTPHGWRNSGNIAARAAFVFTPADSAKFFEQLRLLAVPIPSVPPDVLGDLCQRFRLRVGLI